MQSLVEQAQRAIQASDFARAAAVLGQLVERTPRDHGAWYWLAFAQVHRGLADLALPAIQTALRLDRRNPEYHNLLGVVIAETGDYEGAMQSFHRALKFRPFLTNAHFNLGKMLNRLERFDESLEAYGMARKLEPQRTDAWDDLAETYWRAGRVAEAQREYAAFAAAHPGNPDAARGVARTALGTQGAARTAELYDAAVSRFPDDALLRWDRARVRLGRGDFAKGWADYLWRPGRGADRRLQPGADFVALSGDGAPRRLLLEQDQGIGDVVFFARFIPALRSRGVQVTLRCEPKLVHLMRRLDVVDHVVAAGEAAGPPAEAVFALDDLPSLLRSDRPAPSLRLPLDPARVAEWRSRLAQAGPPPYVAVTWRAGTDQRSVPALVQASVLPFKEIKLPELIRALEEIPATLVVVQRTPAAGEVAELAAKRAVLDLSALNDDLVAMCEALSAVDDYVGVPNANVHFMAAVGGAARVLAPYPPEWRWMLEGDESPWFPGCRIYRQGPDRSWAPALEKLRSDLAARPTR